MGGKPQPIEPEDGNPGRTVEFCQHSVNKKLKNDGKRRKVVKGKSPGQRLFLSKLPGSEIAPSFPRTEEVRGSNPLTSTRREPQVNWGFLVL